jgi:hypothetical protein
VPPVLLEVVTPLPEGWGVCVTCELLLAQADPENPPHSRGLDEYPPEWQAEFQRFSDLIFDLAARYGSTLLIRIIDPRSLQGIWKSIRYRVHRYPAFIVNGREKIAGWNTGDLDSALQAAGAAGQCTPGSS